MGFTQILILIEVWWVYTNTNINRGVMGFTQILILIALGVMGFTQILILIEVWWVLHKY